jgi:tetratricopeptide (TPR) repeat protein
VPPATAVPPMEACAAARLSNLRDLQRALLVEPGIPSTRHEADAPIRPVVNPPYPHKADTFAALSDIAVLARRIEEGLEHIHKAFRLNPFPASWYYLRLGQAQYAAGEYEAAVETLRRRRLIVQAHAVSWRQALRNSAGSTRSNCSSSATRISQPATGPRRSHSATLRRLNSRLPQGRFSGVTAGVIEGAVPSIWPRDLVRDVDQGIHLGHS